MLVLLFFMRKRLGGLENKRVMNGLLSALFGGGTMALALWGWLQLTSTASAWLSALGGIAVGGVVYLAVLLLLRVPELKTALLGIKSKLIKSI